MNRILQKHLPQIQLVCQQSQVKHLYAFGSVLTPRFSKNSDVDFIVKFAPIQPDEKIPLTFMKKYEFGKDDYSLNVQNVIGGPADFAPPEDFEGAGRTPPPGKKGKGKRVEQPTLF